MDDVTSSHVVWGLAWAVSFLVWSSVWLVIWAVLACHEYLRIITHPWEDRRPPPGSKGHDPWSKGTGHF